MLFTANKFYITCFTQLRFKGGLFLIGREQRHKDGVQMEKMVFQV